MRGVLIHAAMKIGPSLLMTLVSILCFIPTKGQKGPGGVSIESGGQSTCRAWLDASSITSFADGDELTLWDDVSLSTVSDDAIPDTSQSPPYFRDDPANTINGYPVVTFDIGRFLLLNSSSDLNLDQVTLTKTVFLAFRTGTEVNSKQIIYEEGGCWRGLNIYIQGDSLYCGAYDLNSGGIFNEGEVDLDNTPQWGYSFVNTPVEANSTYILTMQFSAADTGFLSTMTDGSNGYYIRGWLNGEVFGEMDFSTGSLTNTLGTNDGVNGIGSLWKHPDPIGLGAINNDAVDHQGRNCNNMGGDPFLGRLAEVCYYNDLLGETERIIVENYLGAKYFANIIENDKYAFQAVYGRDVIGIGQQTNDPTNLHNLSQGRNPFLISADPGAYNDDDQYFFTGHNGANFLYTETGVPNNSTDIRRLQRIWRVDKQSDFPTVIMTLSGSDLPPAPAGFNRLVLLLDETSPNFPNFTLSTTKVIEVPEVASGEYEIDYDFPDNSFYTFGWLRPRVEFTTSETFAIESDPSPDSSQYRVGLKLNFLPHPASGNFTIDYSILDGTATATNDYGYDYTAQQTGISFAAGKDTTSLDLYVKNDDIDEDPSSEFFEVILLSGDYTTPGLEPANRDTLVFSIYDDDPPPKASFDVSTSFVLESVPLALITVIRQGETTDSSVVVVKRKSPPDQGTAAYGSDFSCINARGWSGPSESRVDTVIFEPGADTRVVEVDIFDDEIYEEVETAKFVLETVSGIGADASGIFEHTLEIVDDEDPPTVEFITDNQTGYESVGDPFIYVELSRKSTRDVEVDYAIVGGTAQLGFDYQIDSAGTIIIQAGDTLGIPLQFSVDNGDPTADEDPMDDEEASETIIFELQNATNGNLGPTSTLTYTILDTSPFEWRGAAGVGKESDNIVWIDADRMSGLGAVESLNNFSPRDIDVVNPGTPLNRAELLENQINGKKALHFDGGIDLDEADLYQIDDNSFTNLAGFMEKKSLYFVIQPDYVPFQNLGADAIPDATECAVIYEQGGGSRGLSVYLYNNYLWLHAWNDSDNGPESPWGIEIDGAGIDSAVYARSSQQIMAGNSYVVSCHYDNFSEEPLMVYVNGVKGVMSPNLESGNALNLVGRLYAHSSDIGLGAVLNGVRFHFTTENVSSRAAAYEGLMAEFIKFHEPQMNKARRVILENYLSAKFNIPLSGADTEQVFDLTYASSGGERFNRDVAGVGREGTEVHTDAQGNAELRIQDPVFSGSANGYLIWGHNGESMTNTWPFSYWNADLPGNIQERSGKVWRLFESDGSPIDSVEVFINFSSSDSAQNFSDDPSLLKLLVHSNTDPNDFSNASIHDVFEIKAGFVARFRNVPLNDGDYLALGNTGLINVSPLPIELISFDARLIGTSVELTWETASELNCDYFLVERTGNDLLWESIMTVPGAGNSNELLRYREFDRNPLDGVSYYRLKQVDFNGDYSYSDPVSIVTASSSSKDLILFPNPTGNGKVFIRLPNSGMSLPTEIIMHDMSGKVVSRDQFPPQTLFGEFRFGELEPGVYFITVRSEVVNENRKLIVR